MSVSLSRPLWFLLKWWIRPNHCVLSLKHHGILFFIIDVFSGMKAVYITLRELGCKLLYLQSLSLLACEAPLITWRPADGDLRGRESAIKVLLWPSSLDMHGAELTFDLGLLASDWTLLPFIYWWKWRVSPCVFEVYPFSFSIHTRSSLS